MLRCAYMTKALAALLISLGVLAPALASAHSSPKPPKDTTPPALTSIQITSSNASTTLAKAGDTVTLSFTASEKVLPVVLVETKTLFVRARNTAGNSWEASYVVNAKDRAGKVDYLITLLDMSKNGMVCSSARLPYIKYCPTTDGSSVSIYKDVPPPPPADTQAPVIAAHGDVYATTSGATAEVPYTAPAATDNIDASVAVSCAPASGSTFALGTTTVTCSAQDAAGNQATSTFAVGVVQEVAEPPAPTLYTMAQQPDESYLCGAVAASWRYCDAEGTFSFTDAVGEGVRTIDLGAGSGLGDGTIQTVTIAKDSSGPYGGINLFHPWGISISCFNDAAHVAACGDWGTISDDANESGDGTYWSANFSSLNRTFKQDAYYVMTIDDTGWEVPVLGSEPQKEPYWKIVGLH